MAEAGGRGDIDPTGSSQVMYQETAPTVVAEPARQDDETASPETSDGPAHVDITQVSVNRNVAPRKEMRYLIRLRNTSANTARNLGLRCALPVETSFVEGSLRLNGRAPAGEGAADPSRGVSLPDLDADAEIEVTFACNVHSGLRDGSLLYHTVTLLSNDRQMANHTSCAIVRGTPSLADSHACRLLASPAGEVAPGDVITYTYSLSNNGTAQATGLMLFTAAPVHVAYVPNSTRWEGIPLADVDDTSPLFSKDGFFIGTLEPGQAHSASLCVRVERPLDNGRRVICEGELRSHEGEAVKLEAVAHDVRAAPDFSDTALNRLVVMADDKVIERAAPGDLLTVAVDYANRGNSNAYDSRIWVDLSPRLEYVGGTLRHGDRAVPQDQTAARALFSEAGYMVGTVEAASEGRRTDSHKLTFQARVAWPLPNDTELPLTSGIISGESTRQDFQPVTLRVTASPRFADTDSNLHVAPEGPVQPGDVLSYTIRYRNSGDAPATRVVLRAGLPFEADGVPGSTKFEGRGVPDEDGTSVLLGVSGLDLGTVDAGKSGEVTFQATVGRPLYAGTQILAKAALTCEEMAPVVFAPVSVEVTSRADFSNRETNYIEVTNLRGNAERVIAPSDNVTFTLHFKNEGDSIADNAVLHAAMPDNATPLPRTTTLMLEAPRRPAHEHSLNDVNGISPLFAEGGYILGKIEPGTSGRLTYTMKVNRPLVDGSLVTHSATLTSEHSDPMVFDEARVKVTAKPNFTETQWNRLIVSPAGAVSPGQKLSYSLEYRNTGGADATAAMAAVTLPADVEYVSESVYLNGSQIADVDGNNALFSERGLGLGDLAIDRSGRVTFEARVKSPLDNNSALECAVNVTCDQLTEAVRHTVDNKVTSAPDFGQPRVNYLSAEPADKIAPNEVITYTVAFANTGDARAYRVALRANVPQQVTYVPGSTRLNGHAVPDVEEIGPLFTSNGLLVGSEEADAEGNVTFQVKVVSPLENDSSLEAQAFIALGERRGGAAGEPQRRFPTNRITHRVSSAPDFSEASGTRVEVSPEAMVRPGELLLYTVHVLNGGTAHAQDVSVRAFVPQHTTLVPSSVRIAGAYATAEELDHLFSPRGKGIGRVEAGASCIITYQVKAETPLDNETAIVNKALVMATGITPVNTPEVTTLVISAADFSVEAGNRVVAQVNAAQPGEAVTFTIYYKNGGDANAYSMTAKLQLPENDLHYVPHLTTVNGVPVGGQSRTLNAVLGEGIPIGDVPAGAGGEASFTVRVDAAARDSVKLPVVVELNSPLGPPSILEGTPLEVSAPPAFSDPAFNHLDVYPTGSVACEEILTYTLTYGNRTNAPATDVVLRCAVPEHTVYVEETVFLNGEPVDDTAAHSNPLFTPTGLRLGTVEARTSGEVVFQVRVKKNAANDTAVAGTATIQSSDKTPFTTNTTRNTVHSLIDFSGTDGAHLEVTPAQNAAPGETLTYVFNYRNRGNATATNVVLRGKLPENATYVGRSTKLNGIPVKDSKRLAPIFNEEGLLLPEIPPGGSGRILYRLQIGNQLPANSSIVSQLSLSCDQIPAVSSNTVTNTVISYPSFRPGEGTFLQSHPPRFVMPGNTITFVLYYQNGGSLYAKELRLKARLPAHTNYVANTTRVDGSPVEDVDTLSPLFDREGLSVGRVEAGASGDVSLQLRVADNAAEEAPIQFDVEMTTLPPTSPIQLSGQVVVTTKPPVVEPPAPPVSEERLAAAAVATVAAAAAAEAPRAEAEPATTDTEDLDAAERAAALELEEQERAEAERRRLEDETAEHHRREGDEEATQRQREEAERRQREDEERTRREAEEAEQRLRDEAERRRREDEEAERRRREDEETARRRREDEEAERRRNEEEERARRERDAEEAEQRQREETERRRREDEEVERRRREDEERTRREREAEEAEQRQREEEDRRRREAEVAERQRREQEEAERRQREQEEQARLEREAEEAERREKEEAEQRRREAEARAAAELAEREANEAARRRELEEAERRRREDEERDAELAEQRQREEADRRRREEEDAERRRREDEVRARREAEEAAALAALEAEEAAARAALEAEDREVAIDEERAADAEEERAALEAEAARERARAPRSADEEADETEEYEAEAEADEEEEEAEAEAEEDELDEDEGEAIVADDEEAEAEAEADEEDDDEGPQEREPDDEEDEAEAEAEAADEDEDEADYAEVADSDEDEEAEEEYEDEDDDEDYDEEEAAESDATAVLQPQSLTQLTQGISTVPTSTGVPMPPAAANLPTQGTELPLPLNPHEAGDPSKRAHAHYERGMNYTKMGDYRRAIEDLTMAVHLNPQDAHALYNRGYAWLRAGMFTEAIEDFTAGLRLKPGDANVYFNLGNAYGKAGNFQSAMRVYSEAIRINPSFAPAYANRGLTYWKLGMNEQAEKDFTAAIRLDPQIKAKLPDGPWKKA